MLALNHVSCKNHVTGSTGNLEISTHVRRILEDNHCCLLYVNCSCLGYVDARLHVAQHASAWEEYAYQQGLQCVESLSGICFFLVWRRSNDRCEVQQARIEAPPEEGVDFCTPTSATCTVRSMTT